MASSCSNFLCCKSEDSADEQDSLMASGRKGRIMTAEKSEDSQFFYRMNHSKRGIAVIFNHEYFEADRLSRRSGTKIDCENMRQILTSFGFDVQVHEDFTSEQIKNVVAKVASIDHSDCDCFVMVVMSHGKLGELQAKDYSYSLDTLWISFTSENCPTLNNKPKIFFIQACQGELVDEGITLITSEKYCNEMNAGKILPKTNETEQFPIHFFTEPDFLIVCATVPGYYSWRNTTQGSWFIQALVAELEQKGSEQHMLTLLTFVFKRVAMCYQSHNPYMPWRHNKKQIPFFRSTLTKFLKFTIKKKIASLT